MLDVYINGFGAFFPGPPVGNDEMESHLGRIGGKPSRYGPLVLRNNKITSRHYALDAVGLLHGIDAEQLYGFVKSVRNARSKDLAATG